MSIGIWQLILVLILVFVIFGAGKLPKVMGDFGRGIRSLKKGLNENDSEPLSSKDVKISDLANISEANTTDKVTSEIMEESNKKSATPAQKKASPAVSKAKSRAKKSKKSTS